MSNEAVLKAQENNRRIYAFYKMIAVDLLFYYTIKFLFLTEIKGLSVVEITFAASFYGLFRLVLQLPITMIIDKIGKRNAIILGNSINCIYLLLLFSCSSVWQLIFAQLFCAIGFNLKGVAEPSLLNASITDKEKRGKIFSKIDGTGLSRYYYLSAISAVASGFCLRLTATFP